MIQRERERDFHLSWLEAELSQSMVASQEKTRTKQADLTLCASSRRRTTWGEGPLGPLTRDRESQEERVHYFVTERLEGVAGQGRSRFGDVQCICNAFPGLPVIDGCVTACII